ncbi:MAG: O-antigen ligase family protein [Gammaproteobacteria bacterium]|nr:O-antigen ligase family protein [Gammaproteobacteria bacterium]
MGKKHRKKKNRQSGQSGAAPAPSTSRTTPKTAHLSTPKIAIKKPVIPAFWIAVIIPVICLVGAWSYPPVATPMELKSYTSQIYLSGLLLLWLWLQRNNKTAILIFSPGRIAFGLLFLAGTLSLLWAANPDFWVYKWNKWYAGFVMFLLGVQIIQNEKNLSTVIHLSILGGLITAAIGIAQYLFNVNVVPQTSFPSSTFGNGNMAGQVMVLTGLLPLYFLFKEKQTKGKTWFYALAMAIVFAYAFYTRTRAVWLSCLLEIFLVSIFIVFDKKYRTTWLFWSREKSIASLAAFGLFLILINFNQNGFQPFWTLAASEISSIATSIGSSAAEGEHRYLIWTAVGEMIRDNPIMGTGLGSFFHNYNIGGYANYNIMGVQRAHNDVLELAVELGALGMLFLLGIIITMCTLLFKLISRCEGQKRILFALLTIVVTGSMMNAQVSFPYQLPVPYVIMPFFMALIIRGSEDIENNLRTITLEPVFNKAAAGLSGLIFAFLLINDLAWMRDIHQLNRIVARELTNVQWETANPIFNQAYITGGRSVTQVLNQAGQMQLARDVIPPLIEYWPNSAANTLLAAENFLNLGQFEESEYWARMTIESQPEGAYIGQYFLMEIYMRKGETENLKNLYDSMKDDSESLLSMHSNSYNLLHSMSINVEDFERTTFYYNKFKEYFGELASVEGNQAIFYINTGNIPAAEPYMRRALEMNPNLPNADTFNQFLIQLPQ